MTKLWGASHWDQHLRRIDEDDGALREKNVVEDLPVLEPLEQPGLVDAAHAEPDGHGEVPDERPLFNGHVLQGCIKSRGIK